MLGVVGRRPCSPLVRSFAAQLGGRGSGPQGLGGMPVRISALACGVDTTGEGPPGDPWGARVGGVKLAVGRGGLPLAGGPHALAVGQGAPQRGLPPGLWRPCSWVKSSGIYFSLSLFFSQNKTHLHPS